MMKNIGKIKQWTGERLGASKTTFQTEDFKELERQTELVRASFDKVLQATQIMQAHLAKQKVSPEDGKTKAAPIAALGKCFHMYGSDVGKETDLGASLIELGSAEMQIAQLQNAFSTLIKEDYLNALETVAMKYKEYVGLRKKLESRRLDYDAKLGRLQKAKKEKPELEQEVQLARTKYEETQNELLDMMVFLKENEASHQEALRRFVEAQHHYYTEALEQLASVMVRWPESGTATAGGGSVVGSPWQSRSSSFSSSISAQPIQNRSNDDYFRRGSESNGSFTRSPGPLSSLPRRLSTRQGSTDSLGIGPPRRMPSASSLRSVTSDRSTCSVRVPPAVPRRQSQSQASSTNKLRKALFDFAGETADELSFRVGDVIAVMDEVDEGWWMGETEHQGQKRRGIFPVNYTEEWPVANTSARSNSPPTAKYAQRIQEHPDEQDEMNTALNGSPFSDAMALHPTAHSPTRPLEATNGSHQSTPAGVRAGLTPPVVSPSPPLSRSTTYVPLDTKPSHSAARTPPPPPAPRTHTSSPIGMVMARQTPPPSIPSGGMLPVTQHTNHSEPPCQDCGCDEFCANVFKKGRCQNCFHDHQ